MLRAQKIKQPSDAVVWASTVDHAINVTRAEPGLFGRNGNSQGILQVGKGSGSSGKGCFRMKTCESWAKSGGYLAVESGA